METTLIIIAIIFVMIIFGLIFWVGVFGFAAFYAMKTNLAYQNQIKEYGRFFEILLDTLTEDTVFLKGELARTIKAEQIPQYKELNHGLLTFETHIQAIRDAMREMNLISD